MTRAYLIHWTDFVKDVKLDVWADEQQAMDAENRLLNDRTSLVTTGWERLTDNHTISGTLLIALYNAITGSSLTKFETREIGARRTFAAIEKACAGTTVKVARVAEMAIGTSVSFDDAPPATDATDATDAPPATDATDATPATDATDAPADEAEVKTKQTPPAREKRSSGGAGANQPKAPKPVSEFKQVRKNTARCMVLELMDGTLTSDAIAVKVFGAKKDGRYVMQHAHCTHRDCGIGYGWVGDGERDGDKKISNDDRLIARFPAGKTLADAIKE